MKKIVVLDGYALNPGDLSTETLQKLGDCSVYDYTAPQQTVSRAVEAEIVLTNKTRLKRSEIEALPNLQYIGVLATGYNNVDIEAARERGIVVSNVPAYSTPSVAQLVFAHLLHLTSHVGPLTEAVREGRWSRNRDFCFWDAPLTELCGKTMGLVGFGNTGSATAAIARGFGMSVITYTSKPQNLLPEGVRSVSLEALFSQSDVVSLHCPLSPETRGLVNRERLSLMKPSSLLINTSRGPVVDETALAEVLNTGKIAGAGVDVLSAEPPHEDNVLLHARNCSITPHIAWATREARERLMQTATDNVRAFLNGSPQNDVTRP